MAEVRGVPPGRAGRLWLRRRLAAADRAATLLDRKVRILTAERTRLRVIADRAATAWRDAFHDAETWLARLAAVHGQAAVRHATAGPPAVAEVTWTTTAGVRYPAGARCDLPATGGAPATLGEATAAYRTATRAGVAYAAALAAWQTVDAELGLTRRRLRALTDRRIPLLAGALAAVGQRLEENERAESVRLRWAARTGGSGSGRE